MFPAAAALALAGAGRAAEASGTRIEVDPYCRRSINGISELRRETYFGLCDPGTAFDRRSRSPERYQFLIKENGITFGRRLNIVSGLASSLREDPLRPGFADLTGLKERLEPRRSAPGASFERDMGGRLEIAAHENHNAFPRFMGTHVSAAAAREARPDCLPENTAAAAELTAAVLRHGFTDFDRPSFVEPINEPHWSYWKDEHLARWHLATMEAVHRETPGVLVGGPCLPVAYFYRNQYTAFDGLRAFIDNTGGRLDFYSFHCYDYLREKNGDFGGRISSGLPLESVLDLVQSHTARRYGKEVAIVVSEHGGYGANELVEKLARRHFPGTGFEWEMKRRSIDDFNMVSSVIANTLVFMDHPHTVRKAVPFILPEAAAWNPQYYAVLYVPRDYDPKSEWVPTRKIMFYQFFRDLKGHRVAAYSPDPDIQARAFVDGRFLFVLMNNLSNCAKPLTLDLTLPRPAVLRRFGRNADFSPYLTEGPLAQGDRIELRPREAMMIKAEFPEALAPRSAVNETSFYGTPISTRSETGESRFSVLLPASQPPAYATLRVGVSRPAAAGWQVRLTLNGRELSVPLESCAERLVADEYASCKMVRIAPGALKAVNTIGVSFPDGRPGAVGSVVIRTASPLPIGP